MVIYMYRNYLDLNKKSIRRNVIFKLKILGYDIEENVGIRTIQSIIEKIQLENGLISDGLIGRNTMPLLGYNQEEIKKMLKIPDSSNKKSVFDIFIHLLLF